MSKDNALILAQGISEAIVRLFDCRLVVQTGVNAQVCSKATQLNICMRFERTLQLECVRPSTTERNAYKDF
jgi:hypothetical protein